MKRTFAFQLIVVLALLHGTATTASAVQCACDQGYCDALPSQCLYSEVFFTTNCTQAERQANCPFSPYCSKACMFEPVAAYPQTCDTTLFLAEFRGMPCPTINQFSCTFGCNQETVQDTFGWYPFADLPPGCRTCTFYSNGSGYQDCPGMQPALEYDYYDADGDGYLYPWDCKECDFNTAPGKVDCPPPNGDSIDNDCDGTADNGTEVCGDLIDNDCDGQVDEITPGGNGNPEKCNGLDDDCDGEVDEGVSPFGEEICDDGLDNNCNDLVDEGCECDEDDDDCCDKSSGYPVNITSGMFYTAATDVTVRTAGVPLAFSRRYSLGRKTSFAPGKDDASVLGLGWRHNWDERIKILSSSAIMVAGGGTRDFRLDLDPGAGVYRSHGEGRRAVAVNDGGWVLHHGDGTRSGFDSNNRLLYRVDRYGKGIRVYRYATGDHAGKIQYLKYFLNAVGQMGPGAWLELVYFSSVDYTNGLLQKVRLHSGGTIREWAYAYDKPAPSMWPVLTTVTDPTSVATVYRHVKDAGAQPSQVQLARVERTVGGSVQLVEAHQFLNGRVYRSIGPQGDLAYKYSTTSSTVVYSEPYQGGACSAPPCEGVCTEDINRPCFDDSDCATTCDFTFGRHYKYCVDDASCNVQPDGSQRYCVSDPLLTIAGGRCFNKESDSEFSTDTKRLSSSGCCGGDSTTFGWSGSRVVSRKSSTTNTYATYQFDQTTGHGTDRTLNNQSELFGECAGVPDTNPCLRARTTYMDGSVRDEDLVTQVERTSALGSFGDRKTIYEYANDPPRLIGKAELGKTHNQYGDLLLQVQETGYTVDVVGRVHVVDPPNPEFVVGDNSTTYSYHTSGQGSATFGRVYQTTRNNPVGHVSALTTTFEAYNEFGQPTEVMRPDGVAMVMAYDLAGRLTSVVQGPEQVAYSYDPIGRVSSISQGGARCVFLDYNIAGKVYRIIEVDGSGGSCPGSATTSDGDHMVMTYDRAQRLAELKLFAAGASTAASFVRTFEYDGQGNLRKRFDKGSSADFKTFLHDALGRQTDMGNELCMACQDLTTCDCPRTAWQHNGLHQVTQIRQYISGTQSLDTSLEYDAAANVKRIVAPAVQSSNTETAYVFDDFGRVVELSSPDSGITRFEYDENNNVRRKRTAVSTPDETEIAYKYDGLDRLIEENPAPSLAHCSEIALGQTMRYHYDGHQDCQALSYCSHGAGRLVMVEVELGCSNDPTPIPLFRKSWFSYDTGGRVVAEKQQWPVGGGDTFEALYEHDGQGNLMLAHLPTGGTLEYTRGSSQPSDSHRVTAVSYNGQTVVQDVQYFPFGGVQHYTLGSAPSSGGQSVTVTHSRDSGYFLTGITTNCTGLYTAGLTPDIPKRIAQRSLSVTSCAGCPLWCIGAFCARAEHNSVFDYDYLGRLKSDSTHATLTYSGMNIATRSYSNGFGADSLTMSYHAGTNRLDTISRSSTSGTIGFAQNGQGARAFDWEEIPGSQIPPEVLGRAYAHYPSGRLMALMGWTPHQESDGMGGWVKQYLSREGFSFYDHRGRRIYKQVIHDGPIPPETWFYFYDLQDRLVSEIRVVSGQDPEVYEYVHLEKIPVFQRATVASGVLDYYLIANHLRQPVVGFGSYGTTPFVSDVDPFGWTQQKQNPYATGMAHMPLRLPGQYEDSETAVKVFNPYDYGDPGVESELLVYRPPLHYNWHRYYDPLVGRYISADPSGQGGGVNVLSYAGHDPINREDQSGLLVVDITSMMQCYDLSTDFGTFANDMFNKWLDAYRRAWDMAKAKNRKCVKYFEDNYNTKLTDLIKYGTDPIIRFSQFLPVEIQAGYGVKGTVDSNLITFNCFHFRTMSVTDVAAVLMHELSHHVNDNIVPGVGKKLPDNAHNDSPNVATSPGYEAETACRGAWLESLY